MALDLLTFDPENPDLHWMYAHATLHRLFRANTDNRQQFYSRIPGFKAALSRANIVCNNFNSADLILQHYLIELDGGWLNILGGTEWPLGWPYHAWSLLEVPALTPTDYFPSYWWLTAGNTLQDLATVIPAGDARPIMFSGHSLGGASSVAAAYKDFNRSTSRRRSVVNFGAPLTRGVDHMDGRDIPCCRVWNTHDLVPSLPQHLVKVGLGGIIPVKIPLFSLYHHGLGFSVDPDGITEQSNGGAFRSTAAAAALLAMNTFGAVHHRPWTTHFMATYAYLLRLACDRQQVQIDPLWDEINYYVNQVDGIHWNFAYFPPSAFTVPPTVAPNPIDLGAAATLPDLTPFDADLLIARPAVPVISGQSLAAQLGTAAGFALDDVTIHLSQAPVADPLNVDLSSFTEADFSGYQCFGGPEWLTTQPVTWTSARRYQARALFGAIGDDHVNTVYAWYAVGHKTGTGQKVLLDWQALGAPFVFDRPRVLCIEYSLVLGPA